MRVAETVQRLIDHIQVGTRGDLESACLLECRLVRPRADPPHVFAAEAECLGSACSFQGFRAG